MLFNTFLSNFFFANLIFLSITIIITNAAMAKIGRQHIADFKKSNFI